jgi:hypothetical protein
MRMVADRIDAMLADKAYDAAAIRKDLANDDIEALFPARATAATRRRMTEPSTAGANRSSGCLTS